MIEVDAAKIVESVNGFRAAKRHRCSMVRPARHCHLTAPQRSIEHYKTIKSSVELNSRLIIVWYDPEDV